MKRGREVTKVIFRKKYWEDTKEWDIIAFFPGAEACWGRIMSYMHVGQHGEADLEFYWSTKKCTQKEYTPLKKELENLFGYNFNIVQKLTYKDRIAAWKREPEN